MGNDVSQKKTKPEDTISESETSRKERVRPDVFSFTDYKALIKEMVEYLKEQDSQFSIRKLSSEAGFSNGYLTIIFNTPQHVAHKTLDKIIMGLRLSPAEGSYLRLLRDLAGQLSPEERERTLKRLQKFRKFKEEKPNESLMIQYLQNWYLVAIRELAHDPDFQLDAEWVRTKLQFPVTTLEIEKSLEFLVSNGLLSKRGKKKAEVTTKDLTCDSQILSVAMANFHRQIFDLASKSIDTVNKDERNLDAQLMTLDNKGFEDAKAIMNEALDKVAALKCARPQEARVYDFSLLAFPLTAKKRRGHES